MSRIEFLVSDHAIIMVPSLAMTPVLCHSICTPCLKGSPPSCQLNCEKRVESKTVITNKVLYIIYIPILYIEIPFSEAT